MHALPPANAESGRKGSVSSDFLQPKGVRLMRIAAKVLVVCFLSLAALLNQQQAAQAGAYDDQCKASGGTALVWDGVGLRWCCIKRSLRLKTRFHKTTLWC